MKVVDDVYESHIVGQVMDTGKLSYHINDMINVLADMTTYQLTISSWILEKLSIGGWWMNLHMNLHWSVDGASVLGAQGWLDSILLQWVPTGRDSNLEAR